MKTLLASGREVLLDDDMHELLSHFTWNSYKSRNTYYVERTITLSKGKQKNVRIHHYIIGYPLKGMVTDHINGNGLDNRRANLRHVTLRQNGFNRKDGRRFPGVFKRSDREKWWSVIKINGKPKYLGTFNNEIDAAKAYQEALKTCE